MAKHILLGEVRKLVSCTFVDTAANRKIYNDCDSVILPKQSNQNIISQITSLRTPCINDTNMGNTIIHTLRVSG